MKPFDPADVTLGLVTDMGTAVDFLNWIKNVPDQLIGCDTETGGLSWYDDRLRLVQFGTLTEGWAVPYQENKMLVREALNILSERKKFFVFHNCFSGDEKVLTRDGRQTLRELSDSTIDLWTTEGWRKGTVRSYGFQRVQNVVFAPKGRRSSVAHTVRVTPDHGWYLTDGSKTNSLMVGDAVIMAAPAIQTDTQSEAYRHGLVFADGTSRQRSGKFANQIRLCGAKSSYLPSFESVGTHTYPASYGGDPMCYFSTGTSLKALPSDNASNQYVHDFIAGWSALDGTHCSTKKSRIVNTVDLDAAHWLRDNAVRGGFVVVGYAEHQYDDRGYSAVSKPVAYITLTSPTNSNNRFDGWTVKSITPVGSEEVFCAEVPGPEGFTLASGIYTSNCKFDLHYLERNTGWTPRDWMYVHDTMLLGSVLNSSWSKALKDLAEFYVWRGAKIGQSALEEDFKKGGWFWDTVPVDLPSYWIYGVLDTIMTTHLFYILHEKCTAAGVMDAYAVELGAMPALYAIERNGMLLDSDHCREQQNTCDRRAVEIEAQVQEQYGIENVASTDQLALAFLRHGVELTEKTDTGRWKMDADTFDLIAATQNHPLLALVKEYRSLTRMSSTYYGNFLKYQRSDGRCHPFYWATTARTGRMSATEPAILTVPRPDEDKSVSVKEVRNSFVAADGNLLISTDFSNVEARIFAHFANEEGMKQAFEQGINLHKFTASRIFDKPIESIDKGHSEYTIAKNTLFGKLFGAGVARTAITAGITIEKAQEASDGLNRAFPGMKRFQKESQRTATDNLQAHGQAFIRGIDGRILAMVETDDRYYAFTNWAIQSSACVVLKKALAVAHNMGLSEYCVAAIHDEIVAEIPEEYVTDFSAQITEAMTDNFMFSVPIICAIGEPSQRWGECK